MLARLASIVLLLLALVSTPARADPADIAATARSVVRVVLVAEEDGQLALAGHGTGVAIAPDLILTNAHVVAEAADNPVMRIGIVPSQGKGGWFAAIVAVSPGQDLALLRLTEPGALPAATLFTGAVSDGADVFAVGYPGNVDMAQGLNIGDIVSPTEPVKTRGSVSAGRSSKQFDTILHTAAIGSGNSGGPLLDGCGRVIGINSFGTLGGEADSEFYFAVSMREVARFLTAAKVQPRITGAPCRSIAELDRAEAERLAAARSEGDAAARTAAEQRGAAAERARREAQLAVIAERENGMALAGLALLLALAAGGAGFHFAQRDDGDARRKRNLAWGAGSVLLLGALAAWLTRPGLSEIDDRAAATSGVDAPGKTSGATLAGDLVCVLDPARSRLTVSPETDVPLNWRADGCVNARSQYGLGADGWSRVLVPANEDTVTVARFDPAAGEYRTDRYLLGSEAMASLRAARAKLTVLKCGADDAAARRLGSEQAALLAALPEAPNERLVYRCRPRTGAPPAP